MLIFFQLSSVAIMPAFGMERQMEALDRGLVAVKTKNGVFISWRVLGDEKDVAFNVYKNGKLIRYISSSQATNMTDKTGKVDDTYVVKAVVNGKETNSSKVVKAWKQDFLSIQLNRPEKGITPPCIALNRTNGIAREYPNGQEYTYLPGDCSVGDLDGDGEYEIIVRWDPSNQTDNSYSGITGPVYLDAYKLNGKHLWRICLGKNIRAGAHYTQFLVYDFDGDGKAELVCKTAPGTVDGKGKKIVLGTDDPDKDWRNLEMIKESCGYVLNGPEYLTIFGGETGEELSTVPYEVARGEVSTWGDSYGNRVDRFLACVAYLDGEHPSIVMCRGYYHKTTLVAYDFTKGKLVKRWTHISNVEGEGAYGQGNHNLSVADVDEDGCDEIIYGSCVINHDGTLLYSTGLGHGDAMHVSKLDPDLPGYQVWEVHEEPVGFEKYGYEMHDARTGKILWGGPTSGDNGRGLAADIDPNHRGFEMWSADALGVYNCKGEKISDQKPSICFRVYWDGDLQDEILNKTSITKWNGWKPVPLHIFMGARHTSGTKAVPNISVDILGDWREEIVLCDTGDPSKLRIYTTTIPTKHRLYTLMHDPVYRLGIAWQNIGYNQPPHLGFYIGDGLENIPWPKMHTP
ncbi:rhamnogalacturonan lyase [Bacteroides ovatus]|nr:rhamnogalacturonan lyase [Bacteroides ovatus]MCM1755126.1 rhamnogalacturonan lyase [Bacteroides ovatus]MCM1867117.1 rhamnogalacturonan lyase [Bacteroides ovatus]MCM1909300.1 rhamnogalacturonan lyase [Bacteroides ovatus]